MDLRKPLNKKTSIAGMTAFAVMAIVGVTLHVTRKPNMVDQGWKVVNCLQNHDVGSLVNLISPEELEMLGVSKEQAARIVERCVMPEAKSFTANLSQVSIAGNSVALERPVGAPDYLNPPTILLARQGKEHLVSLQYLLTSAWAQKKRELRDSGRPWSEYRQYMLDQFRQVKEMGLTKSVNWERHEVHDMPEEPFLGKPWG